MFTKRKKNLPGKGSGKSHVTQKQELQGRAQTLQMTSPQFTLYLLFLFSFFNTFYVTNLLLLLLFPPCPFSEPES